MLTFYIYNPENDENDDFLPESAITIKEFLNNPPLWKPRLEKVIVIFSGISMSLNEDFNSFGILSHILPQLVELKRRILLGEFGLLRTCIQSEALFFVFEPKEDKTFFSSLGVLPAPYLSYYPLVDSPNYFKDVNQQEELYEFIKSNNKDNWKQTLIGNISEIENIEYNISQLVSSIDDQVKLGHELIEFLRKSS
jgi:hypothetical protein